MIPKVSFSYCSLQCPCLVPECSGGGYLARLTGHCAAAGVCIARPAPPRPAPAPARYNYKLLIITGLLDTL